MAYSSSAHSDHAHEHDHRPGFFTRWFFSTNHKDIGTLYLIFAICGVNHPFMPIKVQAVSKPEFDQWLQQAKQKFARRDDRPEDGGTLVRFWQYYARELSDDAYGNYNFNWGYYLESLRLLTSAGAGKPFLA